MRSSLIVLTAAWMMFPSGTVFAAQQAADSTARATGADTGRSFLSENPSAIVGRPGLVHIPVAGSVPQGVVDVTTDNLIYTVVGPRSRARNVLVSIGFLPGLTLTARGSVQWDHANVIQEHDLSVAAHLVLWGESGLRPAVAVGVDDPDTGGAPHYTTYYVTASRSLSVLRLTTGYAGGPRNYFGGLFGGAELDLGDWGSVHGEYDGQRWNAGARLLPFPDLAARFRMQPRLDVVHREGLGWSTGVGLRLAMGPPPSVERRAPRAGARATVDPDSDRLVRSPASLPEIEEKLAAEGLENVRVYTADDAASGETVVVAYENRVFLRNPWHALGAVMGIVARHAPEDVRRMRVIVQRVAVPVLSVESDVQAFRAFVEGRLPDEAFAAQLHVSEPPESLDTDRHAPPANSSRFRMDVQLVPNVQTALLTELGHADARFRLLPEAIVQLGRGLVLTARTTVTLGQTSSFPSHLAEPGAERLLLHKAFRVPALAQSGAPTPLAQVSLGLFRPDEIGAAVEVDVPVAEGRASLGGTLAAFGAEPWRPEYGVALARVRVRHAPAGLRATADAGVFRFGDAGVALQLSRWFGDLEMGFFTRFTTFGSQAGIQLALPLTPARSLRPRTVRPRLPDLWVYQQQATILARTGVIKPYVSRGMETDHELERIYRGRDRLYGPELKANVRLLREGARRFGGW